MYGCGNCGGLFTNDEAAQRKPPIHPWALTASGQRTIARLPGALAICPSCGQQTMYLRSKQ